MARVVGSGIRVARRGDDTGPVLLANAAATATMIVAIIMARSLGRDVSHLQ